MCMLGLTRDTELTCQKLQGVLCDPNYFLTKCSQTELIIETIFR